MWAFLLVFMVIGLRLSVLHLNPRMELTAEERKHIGRTGLYAPRGNIYDRQGGLLATDKKAPSLWVNPGAVTEPHSLAAVLHDNLDMDLGDSLERLTRRKDNGDHLKFVWLKRWLTDVDQGTVDAIVEAGAGAIAVRFETLRSYPQRDTASHLLGFVSRSGNMKEGVEKSFNAYLESVPGVYEARKDVRGRFLPSLTLKYSQAKGGDGLYLTLDSSIQHTLEQELDACMLPEANNAKRAMGMVMDPYSGEILALASRPAFDPNNYGAYSEEARKNGALVDVFEPGSAFKIVVSTAALEHGLITPETMVDCENGAFRPYYGHQIRDTHPMGEEPFLNCFAQSSNIAMVKVAALLGPERLEHWITRFGFGERTSSDFTAESRGIFRKRNKWSGLSMGSLPMGQEISVTIPQLARAFAIIANGGLWVEPYFVERAISRDGVVTYQHEAAETKRMLSVSTAKTMRELCHRVVLEGTGKKASITEYRVGGKTGTAQMARNAEEVDAYGGPGYSPDRYTAVFAGFAPVSNPRLVTVIVVQEPMVRLHHGGHVSAPVFKTVMREALIRMGVPRDPVMITDVAEDRVLAHEEDADTVVRHTLAAQMALDDELLEDLLEPLDGLELVAHKVDEGGGTSGLPSFLGMTKREVKEQLAELDIPWDPRGTGWVVSQLPVSGTPLEEVKLCSLEFSNQRVHPDYDSRSTR
jgi:cell division protein FtsI (penicillin-binding protein 3)